MRGLLGLMLMEMEFILLPNGTDHPKFYGDRVAFFVSADDDIAYKSNMGTDPTHLEFQFIVYSFYRPDVDFRLITQCFIE